MVGHYPTNDLMGRGPLSLRVAAFLGCPSVCGISTAFAVLSPTRRHVPTWSSAVRHSECKHSACDLHALGTPPAFVLSQDQTLRCMAWNATEVTSAPQRNGSGTCASSRFSCEGTSSRWAGRGRIKNQGSACACAKPTPGDVSSHSASACRKREGQPRNPSCYVSA